MPPKALRNAGYNIQKLRLAGRGVRTACQIAVKEIKRGTLGENLKSMRKEKRLANDMSWAELLEENARIRPDKVFLRYEDESFTYRQMNDNANRVGNFLIKNGGGKGVGLGIYMRNSPRFLDVFFGAQKAGMYIVPINPELKGDGLLYIINHSDIELLVLDAELYGAIKKLPEKPDKVKTLIVDDVEEEANGIKLPKKLVPLSQAYQFPTHIPGPVYGPDDMLLIMYTSGTTGRPKGVVSTCRNSRVKLLGFMAGILLKESDVYYTALALCHGNALLLTVTLSMNAGATVALARKFSASGFWDDIRRFDVTIFNTIGSIIPILMKQPEKLNDSDNLVHHVLSAACPADMWVPFEKRFGVTLYEGYGAVDSGGKGVMNFGTAPPGSLGKPMGGDDSFRIVDDNQNPVPKGEAGQLIFKVEDAKSSVVYFKNEEATNKKVHDGWMYTGDFVKCDQDGYLYFVGRDSEHMRKGGENVSAYEVEHVIIDHPAVEDAAVYAVPSELAEDEIMASVKLVPGEKLKPQDLWAWLQDKLARFAVPRYILFVDEFPKTQTHRVIKGELEAAGVTKDTFDAMAK